ncbi:UNVERIFIED_CONTAM: protein DOWNY MILDEW RESISTANCE 6 [Sesamum radiatum]|uniref:Protein DOWNY MILDEW RESISTANCE 6 n=1 Tax=Sesamum radiatum TaxID=300843 RepID=A0AAW2KQ03_SESRA
MTRFMATKVISAGRFSSTPMSYIRPESDRPKLLEVADCDNIPVIDLGCKDRSLISGLPRPLHSMSGKASSREKNACVCRDIVSNYCMEVRQLGFRLQEDISESLGLDKACLKNILGEQGQHMAMNYYPACPQPELTYGLPAHTDPNSLTILLQDLQVAGLQVLKDGKWLAIKPHPNAFVINIGDQIQALSNGRYKSVWHRAVVNADKPRLSVASFLCPCDTARISAPKALTGGGERARSIYRDFTYAEYYKKFWSGNLDQEHCLEFFKN